MLAACVAFCLFVWTSFVVGVSASNKWAAGSYGIPRATSGCPQAFGFRWQTGWRYQDTDNFHSFNQKSTKFHLDGSVNFKGVQRSFCIKTNTNTDNKRPSWPRGKYCIYKKGACPSGMTQGFVTWDDDDYSNKNNKGGTLPDGIYDRNTKIEFCCRTDGNKKHPVTLPTSSPFYLLAYESAECQQVKWAMASVEWILFDNEDDGNQDDEGGAYPYGAGIQQEQHKIHFCYYQGCNITLSKPSGTFHSPNYPQKYPDGQYCSWRITVNSKYRVHLTFTSFSLESGRNTDAVYVYSGVNEAAPRIGIFYGRHPPPRGGVYSSSNHLFVIFKSDRSITFTGFSASYSAVNYPETTTTATTSPVKTTIFTSPSTSKMTSVVTSSAMPYTTSTVKQSSTKMKTTVTSPTTTEAASTVTSSSNTEVTSHDTSPQTTKEMSTTTSPQTTKEMSTITSSLKPEMASSTKELTGLSSSTPGYKSIPITELTGGVFQKSPNKDTTELSQAGVIAAAAAVPFVGFVMAVLLACVICLRRRPKNEMSKEEATPQVMYKSSEDSPTESIDNHSYESYERSEPSDTVRYSSWRGEETSSISSVVVEIQNPLYKAMLNGNSKTNHIYENGGMDLGKELCSSWEKGDNRYSDFKGGKTKRSEPVIYEEIDNPLYAAFGMGRSKLNPVYERADKLHLNLH